MTKGSIGIVDGMKTYAVFKEDGELAPVYSISAGLDYPGVGPEHAYFKDSGRVEYVAATDEEAVQALLLLSKTEGIIPAIESSHAIAEAVKRDTETKQRRHYHHQCLWSWRQGRSCYCRLP